jgi:hypothetical protein
VFLADVEAHSIEDGVIADEDLVQGGQLNVLYAPGVKPIGPGFETSTITGVENLTGTRFSDVFSGGDEDVTMAGLEGADLFVLGAGEGVVTVADFEQGIDHLGLAGDLTFDAVTLTDADGGTTVAAEGKILAVVDGVTLTETDFVLL